MPAFGPLEAPGPRRALGENARDLSRSPEWGLLSVPPDKAEAEQLCLLCVDPEKSTYFFFFKKNSFYYLTTLLLCKTSATCSCASVLPCDGGRKAPQLHRTEA